MPTRNTLPLLLSLLFLLSDTPVIQAQSCKKNFYFNQQSEIDSFPAKYPNCTTIEGSIYIDNSFGGGINNLDSLKQITEVEGDIRVFYVQNLKNLKGLENLHTVGGDVHIELNHNLETLAHLESLKNIGNLYIIQNDSLINLQGLNQIEKIDGSFLIWRNDRLENLVGLESLQTIVKSFTIDENDQLLNLSGLSSLEFIGNDFTICNNESLIEISGLTPTTLVGLESLRIIGNSSLKNLDGLKHFNLGPIQSIRIVSNYNLSQCAVNSLCNYLAICKNIVIETNGNNCDHQDQLLSQCELLSDYNFRWSCPTRLQPNPSRDFLNVNIYSQNEIGSINYELRDLNGRLIMEIQNGGERLDISTLDAGVYFLTIMTELQTDVRRFVKL